VNERILLHLRRYYTAKKEVEAPLAVTQKGIADAIDIRVTHVPRSVRKLDEEGLIYESVMHIVGLDKRRKAYFLTEKGMYQANEIKRNLEDRMVPFRDLDGNIKNEPLSEIQNISGIKLDILDMIRLLDKEGTLNQTSMERLSKRTVLDDEEKERKAFDFPHRVPIIDNFVGRKKDMDVFGQWLKDGSIVLISIFGTPGIGKTTLVGQSLLKLKDKVDIFWFTFGKGDTLSDLTDYLSDFFGRINRLDLRTQLKGKDVGVKDVVKNTVLAIGGSKAVLVFDSVDDADLESKQFIKLLLQELNSMKGAKIILMQREPLRRHIKTNLDSTYSKEFELKGLDKASCKELLGPKKLKKDEFERIYRLTEGNPLSLKLIKSEDVHDLEKSGKYTPDELTLIKYLKALDKI
jgi:hypothetical protein